MDSGWTGSEADGDPRLRVRLDLPLPEWTWPGRATRAFCSGLVSAPQPIESVALLAGRREEPPTYQFRWPAEQGVGLRFWTELLLPTTAVGQIPISLQVRLAGGETAGAELAVVRVVPPPPPAAVEIAEGDELIAVCLATFDPDPALLRRQLDSLRAQTDRNWVCVVSDDCSRPERFALVEGEIDGDPRFAISRSERRLGFYFNFERALRLAPPQAKLIALCDQDDRWEPDKLAVLRSAIGSAPLAYSDARLTDPDGRVLSETVWPGRRVNRSSLASTLIAHSVTGASALFRREVIELALPFPTVPGWAFHDRWLAAVAMARGPVAYVPRPLYDYVQHPGAVLRGRAGSWAEGRSAPRREPDAPPPALFERWRTRYFYGYEPVQIYAATLEHRNAAGGRRAHRDLRRLVAADRSVLGLAWIALRGIRPLVGANETFGYERVLFTGLLWRRLVSIGALLGRRGGPFQPSPPAFNAEALGPPRAPSLWRRLRRGRLRRRGAGKSG